MVTVLDPDRPSVHLAALDVVVHGRVFATKRAPHSPLQAMDVAADVAAEIAPAATWRVGMVHGSIAIPGKTDRDDVVITTEEIAASGLDYLALGHWHSTQSGKAGTVTYAYSGAPEPVALDQDRAGKVLLVELDERAGKRSVTIHEHQVGKTRFEKSEVDAATVASQPALIELLGARADPDLVLDVRLVGVRRDDLDLDLDEIEAALAPSFLKVRVRDVSAAGPDRGAAAVARHDRRRLHPRPRGADRRARGGRLDRRGRRAARCAPPRPAAARRPRGLAVRVRKLSGRDFRRYRTFDIDFAPGLTVIRGPNEAGKTTVQRALELALTRRATSTAAELEALRPWGAPPEARSVITVEFEQDDEDGLKVGTLEKTFAGAKGTVRLDYDGQSISDPTLADQVMAELTGIPTEGFFRSTASVRHFELSDLSRDEGALRDRLQASISGADRGTSRARKKLDKALHDLNTRGDRNPGRLKVAEQAVEQAKAALDQGELALAQLERDRDTLSTARERRAEAETALAERRSLLEKARQAERIAAERDAARSATSATARRSRSVGEIQTLASTHPSPNPLPVLRAGVERLRALDGRIRELRAALSGEVEVQFEVAPEADLAATLADVGRAGRDRDRAGGRARSSLKFLGIADLGIIVQVIGGIVAVVGLAMAAVASGSGAASSTRRRCATSRSTGACAAARRWRPSSSTRRRRPEAQLGPLGLTDLAEAEDLLAREEAHVAQIDRLTAQLDGLVGKEPPETLPTLRDAAALEIEQKTSALEALGPIAKEPRRPERLEVEVRDQEGALERARDDEANARARVEANAVDAEQVAGQAERLAAWREQLAASQRRQRVFATTLEAIDRAEQATMKTATRYLETHMVRDLADRHRRPLPPRPGRRQDARHRGPRPEKDDWVHVSSLSQGTLDLVYLVARLGLVRLVTGDRRPPLVFDDPFVTLDDARAARALGLLKSVAADFQVIYLTTSARYDEAADRVVVLDGPDERRRRGRRGHGLGHAGRGSGRLRCPMPAATRRRP